eukprot:s122_g23.t1
MFSLGWKYHIDDEMVRQVQWCDVEEQHPYLLFYMAQHPVELGEPVPSAEEKCDPDPDSKAAPEAAPEAVEKEAWFQTSRSEPSTSSRQEQVKPPDSDGSESLEATEKVVCGPSRLI